MIVSSLNLIAPDTARTVYNISVNNTGTMVIAQNLDPNAIGIYSIQLSQKYTLRLTEAGNVQLVDEEYLSSLIYVPLYFVSINAKQWAVTASDAGALVITESAYVRDSVTPFFIIY
jgi:hypothetical protein